MAIFQREDIPKELMKTYQFSQEEDWLVCEQQGDSRNGATTSSWKRSLEKWEYYKIVRFYIKDLLNAKSANDNFIFKNIPFLYVCLTGTIVSISSHKEKLCLEVHDGTNSIICMVEENFLNVVEGHKIKYGQDNDISNEADRSTVIFQAMSMTYGATKYLFKNVPSKQDLHLGDIVIIYGKLGEHNGKKYVFASKINIGMVTDFLDNLEYLQNMYKNEYEILR